MLLAIDIGNTQITLGLWNGRGWQLQWRLRTVADKTADEYGIDLKALLREVEAAQPIRRVIISTVVPALGHTFDLMCRRYLNVTPLQVASATPTGIEIRTENPAEVGADRIMNAVAAYHLYAGPSIVVDMGTATTFDVVSGDGALLGVAIAPGPQMAADCLAGRAAQLRRIALEAPPQAIGRNTVQAMQSGLVFGYAALVEGLVGRLKRELNEPETRVIGTGGLINVIAPHTTVFDQVEPWLTLLGLRLVSERNQPDKETI